jgi:spore coat protein U-like protein
MVSGIALGFGPYDVFSALVVDSLTNIDVTCERSGGSQNVTIVMSLGIGTNGTSISARRLLRVGSAGDYLSYGLFRDSSRSSNWGSSPGIDTVSQTLTVPNNSSRSVTFTIYGRIPAQQDVPAGSYGDRIQVTVTP